MAFIRSLFRACPVLLLAAGLAGQTAGQAAAPAAADRAGQNITGTVTNGTTGNALAQAKLTLVRLQGAMQTVSTTTTDAAGRYRFSESAPGPYMVEADFQGVPYFATVAAGQSETNLQVYNVSHDAKLLDVDAEIMVLQPDAGQLAVVNEYRLENSLTPPRTLATTTRTGLFRFRVAPGAQVDMARVVGPNEMPLALQAQPTSEHDVYTLDTPVRPGETRIQISYRIPYPNLAATLSETPVLPPAHFEVYVPSPMKFQGVGLVQLGAQDGYTVYGVASGPVAATFRFQISGDAPLPAAAAAAGNGTASDAGTASSASSASPEAAAPAAAVGPVPLPTFMERHLWMMLALLAVAAAIGGGILLAQPNAQPNAQPTPVPGATPNNPELARLKDDLFLLEVRRHTGDLNEADYQRLRARLNARLDQLARG
ncbi:MAG TPA: carboxypeptidase-like regulatory domain-containing protein [Terriglobales bacterium]|nr:carboxypeptidase-like regulatory domain-containing protein [Terriglobales bacterium]